MSKTSLPEFETSRLKIRQRNLEDLDACLEMDSDPDVMRYMGGVRPSDKRREEFVVGMNEAVEIGLGYWSVFPKDSEHDLLGWIILRPLPGYTDVEIGYRFKHTAWGKGYATEAARAVLRHGFETVGLDEIVAVIHPENERSQRIIKKLGLIPDGMRKAYGKQIPFYRLPRAQYLEDNEKQKDVEP